MSKGETINGWVFYGAFDQDLIPEILGEIIWKSEYSKKGGCFSEVREVLVKNEMKVIMPLMFFVSDEKEKEPEVHNLSIYIGDQKPDVPEGVTIRTFKGKRNLRSFLMAGEWDRATIYKSPECPQEWVDDLTDWMSLHMSLGNVVIFNGDKSGKSE